MANHTNKTAVGMPPEGQGLLIGWKALETYTRHRKETLVRWRKEHHFPVSILPGGHVCSTTSLIDQWLMARAAAYETVLRGAKNQAPLLTTDQLPLSREGMKPCPVIDDSTKMK